MYSGRAAQLTALFSFVARHVAVFLLALCLPIQLWAQDMTLTSRDGAVELSGMFLGFDGEYYRIDTVYGELTVDASGVLCDGPGCPSLEDYVARLSISGAASMVDILMPALVEGFALHEGYGVRRETLDRSHFEYVLMDQQTGRDIGRFRFRTTSSDEGFADLLANEADIAMSLREIRADEALRAREAGFGDLRARGRFRVLALDALIPIVAESAVIDRIATQDLARIFAGQITNWDALGGPDAPISLYLRNRGSGLAQATEDKLLKPLGLTISDAVEQHDSDLGLTLAVSADPFGIGLSSAANTGAVRRLGLTGDCGLALRATRQTVKTEDYPLTAPMFLYMPARRLPRLAREFLFYTQSAPAQMVIRRAGFIDLAPEAIPIAAQGERFVNAISQAGEETSLAELQRMVGVLGPMQRLSTTFRFEAGSARLDAQSRSNVDQLARRLEDGAYDGRTLMFVGFSDGQGAASSNQVIAQRRADTVRQAVIAAAETADLAQVDLATDSFGEALPMACDDSSWGRQVNRRVEVWLR
ncbi:MAG: phosphate ABC transporter substrate-binding/OmpA family protein [Rhodobacterales bacterium]